MILFIARHAWAGHFGDPGWAHDSLRELSPKGIERYRRVVEELSSRGFAPERIATSPYARCLQTAQLISEGLDNNPPVEELEALEPGVELGDLLNWSDQQGEVDHCWVGHNPDVERLTALLLGSPRAGIRFAKGSIAALRFDDGEVRPGGGELLWHVTAKALGV